MAVAVPTEDVIERFVREYLIDLDKVRAYRVTHPESGDNTVNTASTRFLRRPDVRKRVRELAREIYGPLEISAERVLQEIAILGFSSMADYVSVQPDGTAVVDLTQLTDDQLGAIQELTVDEYVEGKGEDARAVKRVKLKLYDKGQNLERLGRHLKLFTDRVEVANLDELAERIRAAREKAGRDLAS